MDDGDDDDDDEEGEEEHGDGDGREQAARALQNRDSPRGCA